MFLDRGQLVHWGHLDSLRNLWELPRLIVQFGDESTATRRTRALSELDGVDVEAVEETRVVVASEHDPGTLLVHLGPLVGDIVSVAEAKMPLRDLLGEARLGASLTMSIATWIASARVPVRRGLRVLAVFVWMGYQEMLAYPLALVMTMVSLLSQPVIYYFVAQLVDSGQSVGGDYYTFVFLGFVVSTMMNGALSAFSAQLDFMLGNGTFETLLVEPVGWRWLSFGMVVWPIFRTVATTLVIALIGLALGAQINYAQLPFALLVIALGVASAHAVGVLAASVKVLSKRADPVLSIYQLGMLVLSASRSRCRCSPGSCGRSRTASR